MATRRRRAAERSRFNSYGDLSKTTRTSDVLCHPLSLSLSLSRARARLPSGSLRISAANPGTVLESFDESRKKTEPLIGNDDADSANDANDPLISESTAREGGRG